MLNTGTGVQYSELNTKYNKEAKTLQLRIIIDKEEVTPRYDQKLFDIENQINTFVSIISPK